MSRNPFDFDAPDGADLGFSERPEALYRTLRRGRHRPISPGLVCLGLLLLMPVVPVYLAFTIQATSFNWAAFALVWSVLYLIVEVITIIWVASDGRGEAGTPAWILVIFLAGALGLVAYLFGRSTAPRR